MTTRHGKRILFIERNLRNEKLGVMYLSGALKASGHHADLIQVDKQDLDERLRSYRPDFVAFSITTGEHLFALKTARRIKREFNITNIFGGPHCTYFPEIGFSSDVDFVVQGQGERAIVDIVEGRIERGFHKAAMAEHLDDLPLPDREILYQYPELRDNPMKNVITSRACPYKCSYCFNHSQLALARIDGETRQWFDRRSVENVVEEINGMRDAYPLQKVLYIDDSFIQSQAWLDAFLTGYTEHVRLPWLCSLRVNCLDDQLAERMFRSGLEMVNYAMESADPDVQQRLLHRGHISNGDVIRAIRLFDRFGIRARMQNMIGLPLENPLEDALNTLQFNMRHRVTDSWCSIFQPYPRTALGQYCVDRDFTTEDQLKHCSESFFDESRLDISHKTELYALQKLWYFAIDGHWPIDLVQVLIRGKFDASIGDQLQRIRFRCSRKKLYGIDDANVSTAHDLKSRERERDRTLTPARPGSAAAHIKASMRGLSVPDQLVDVLSTAEYDDESLRQLARYASGECVFPHATYTIDDETGELANPDDSIYIRGTRDAGVSDIRDMPEDHFMRGMSEVRRELDLANDQRDSVSAHRELVELGVATDHKESIVAPGDGNRDERHLNQYLA